MRKLWKWIIRNWTLDAHYFTNEQHIKVSFPLQTLFTFPTREKITKILMPYINNYVTSDKKVTIKLQPSWVKTLYLTFFPYIKWSLPLHGDFSLYFDALSSEKIRCRLKVRVNTGLNTLGNTMSGSQTILQSHSMQSLTQLHMRSVHMLLCIFPLRLSEQVGRKTLSLCGFADPEPF